MIHVTLLQFVTCIRILSGLFHELTRDYWNIPLAMGRPWDCQPLRQWNAERSKSQFYSERFVGKVEVHLSSLNLLWVQHVSASAVGMSWTWPGGQVISFFGKSWRKDTVGKFSEGPKVPYGSLVLVGCVPIALRTWREDTAKQNERGLCGNRPGSSIYGLFPEGTPYKL